MKKKSERGFRNYCEFTDLYGGKVFIKESSLATKRAVWIFHDHPEDGKTGVAGYDKPVKMAPHLSILQAKKVIKALQRFIDNK